MLFGALAAWMPDWDALSLAAGRWAWLLHHRGASHSLLVLPLAAVVLGRVAWRLAGRAGSWTTWVHLAFWALVTHPLLDCATPYGTQLLAPFSRRRFALDAVGILDPLVALPLWVAALLAVRRAAGAAATRWGWGAIAWMVVAGSWSAGFSRAAREGAVSAMARLGHAVERVRAIPVPGFLPLRRVVVRAEDGGWAVGTASALAPGPLQLTWIEDADGPAVRAVEESPRGRLFTWFADGYVARRLEPREDGTTEVRLHDLRYGALSDPLRGPFAARAVVDGEGRVYEVSLAGDSPRDPGGELALAWRSLWGEAPVGAGPRSGDP